MCVSIILFSEHDIEYTELSWCGQSWNQQSLTFLV